MRRTLDSVAAQSIPPALWIVVDDGSTDQTPAILAEISVQRIVRVGERCSDSLAGVAIPQTDGMVVRRSG